MFSAQLKYQIDHFNMGVNISVEPGQIHALLGASGSGKTTLLRLLCGLVKPDSGKITSGDRTLYDSQASLFVPPQKRNLGLVFQDYALFDHLNVYQNIAYGVQKENQKYVVEDWLKRMGLANKRNVFPQQLSGGEKQRVALARALAASPDILLLDEPFSALNAHLRLGLRRELKQLIKESGVPVLVAIHDLEEAQMLADCVSVLANGELLQSGSTKEVFAEPNSIASAHALGWHNVLPIEHVAGILNRDIEQSQYVALSPAIFKLNTDSPDISAVLVDKVIIQNTVYCDLVIPSGEVLQMQLGSEARNLQISQEYGFSIDREKLVFISS